MVHLRATLCHAVVLVAVLVALAVGVVATPASAQTAHSANPAASLCSRGYYRNVSGRCVHRPSSNPAGATAKWRDGTYSYSQHASGTCSWHGGVARWIHHP